MRAARSTVLPLVVWRGSGGRPLADRLRDALAGTARFEQFDELEGARAVRHEIRVLIDGNPDVELLGGSALRHVLVPWAGVAPEVRERMREHPHLTLHNAHYNAPAVAQHAVAMVLALATRLVEVDRAFRLGDWRERTERRRPSLQLSGRVALLLGYGAIGREAGRLLRSLGMHVRAVRRSGGGGGGGGGGNGGGASDVLERVYAPDALPEALHDADVVVSSLPLTPETSGLLGRRELASMRPGTLLVNVGRGATIDEDALYESLQAGHLGGAGLDVWWRYPEKGEEERTPPARRPFHELENVILSPHRADQIAEDKERQADDVLETVRALLSGGDRNRVDLERGY